MSTISIIGPGNMARLIGVKAVAGGNALEVIGRDAAKAAALAMARWLEGTALVMMGLGRYGVGNFDFTLDVNIPG